MGKYSAAITAAVLLFPLLCLAENLKIVPTTTLAEQAGNNTSTADTFAAQSNGNAGATNVSKVNLHSLLYPGANTKIYAHLMLWFGGKNHMDVGYNSADPVQIKRQVEDMISRGIEGVIIDWYGQGDLSDQATLVLMSEAEAHPGFTFAIMVDKGAILSHSCDGCTPQQALIAHLQYVEQTYFPSPAYMKMQGKPVVTNFDIDLYYSIDWLAVAQALSSDPMFIFQNKDGFSHVISSGSYSWVMPTHTDYGMSYLDSFYEAGKGFASEQTVGATYKGFNDTLAGWGQNRIMSQQCGQTWLQTFAKINSLYDGSTQLSSLQLVTWNDYEEGTELESGIANCLTVAAAVSGNSLQWGASGNESTVDHYTVYISTDGQALMPLTDVEPGLGTLNICSYALDARRYVLFVQAIGKPSLANHLSAPVMYSPSCGGTGKHTLALGVAPSTFTLTAGQSGVSQITVVAQPGPLNQIVTLGCTGLPAGLACAFDPPTVTPRAGAASSVLTISAVSIAATYGSPSSHPQQAPWLAGWFGLGVAGIMFTSRISRRRMMQTVAIGFLLGGALLLNSCGAVGGPSAVGVAPGSYAIMITGSSGQIEGSTPATVQVR